MSSTNTTTDTSKKMDVNSVIIALALALVIIGALNWGTTSYGYNLVDMVAGKDTMFSKAVYMLVALAGVVLLIQLVMKKLKLKC